MVKPRRNMSFPCAPKLHVWRMIGQDKLFLVEWPTRSPELDPVAELLEYLSPEEG